MKGRKGMVLAVLLAVFLSGAFAQAAEPIKIGAIFVGDRPGVVPRSARGEDPRDARGGDEQEGRHPGAQDRADHQGFRRQPEKAFSFAKQLIDEDKVFAIIGPSTSGETMKIKGVAEEGKTILLSCAAAEAIVNPVAK